MEAAKFVRVHMSSLKRGHNAALTCTFGPTLYIIPRVIIMRAILVGRGELDRQRPSSDSYYR